MTARPTFGDTIVREAMSWMARQLSDALFYGLQECSRLREELVSSRLETQEAILVLDWQKLECARLKADLLRSREEITRLRAVNETLRTTPKTPKTIVVHAPVEPQIARRDELIASLRETIEKNLAASNKHARKVAMHKANINNQEPFYRGVLRAVANGDSQVMALVQNRFCSIVDNYQPVVVGPDGDFAYPNKVAARALAEESGSSAVVDFDRTG